MSLPLALQPFATFSYWFTSNPPAFEGLVLRLIAAKAGVGIVAGLGLRVAAGRLADASTRKIVRRLGNMCATLGLLIGISLFFTQQEIPTLGSRFWFLLWLIVGILWLVSILRYAFGAAPRERAERMRQAEIAKYMPKAR